MYTYVYDSLSLCYEYILCCFTLVCTSRKEINAFAEKKLDVLVKEKTNRRMIERNKRKREKGYTCI